MWCFLVDHFNIWSYWCCKTSTGYFVLCILLFLNYSISKSGRFIYIWSDNSRPKSEAKIAEIHITKRVHYQTHWHLHTVVYQNNKIKVICLMLNCTSPCTNRLSKHHQMLLIIQLSVLDDYAKIQWAQSQWPCTN